MTFEFDGVPILLRALLWCFVADEPALKDFFLHKGHAGLLPCPLCANVLLFRYYDPLVHVGFVPHPTTDFGSIVRHTDASVRAIVNDLAAKRITLGPDDFLEAQISAGFNYHEHGLIFDPRVNLVSQMIFDQSHTTVIGGIADTEFGMLMHTLRSRRTAFTYSALGDYLKKWTWPAHQKPDIKKHFDDKAATSHYTAKAFKSTASTFLSLMPVLQFYFQYVVLPAGVEVAKVASFILVLDVV